MSQATAEPKAAGRLKRQSLSLEPLEPRILLDAAIDLHFLPLLAPSDFDTAEELPAHLEHVAMGDTFFLEVWAKNADGSDKGIVGGYLDIGYNIQVTAADLHHGALFPEVASGELVPANRMVEDFGGVAEPGVVDLGVEQWVRFGAVEFTANMFGLAAFEVAPGEDGFGRVEVGEIPWEDVQVFAPELYVVMPDMYLLLNRFSWEEGGNGEAGFGVHTEAVAPDLTGFEVVTPWGHSVSSADILPADWEWVDGAEFDYWNEDENWEMWAEVEDGERFIEFEWFGLTPAQQEAIETGVFEVTFIRESGTYEDSISLADVPMPQETPNITYPQHGATEVPLAPVFSWEAWGEPGSAVWVEVEPVEDDVRGLWTALPADATEWAPGETLELGTEYRAEINFLNFETRPYDGMGTQILLSSASSGTLFTTEGVAPPVPFDPHAAMWLERNFITYSDGEERNEVHTRVRHEELMEFEVRTPWGQFVSSDGIVPTVWDGEPIWEMGDGWWLSAGMEGDSRFIEIVWHDLDQAQWADTQHEFELTAHLLGGAEWFEVWHLGTEVPMPAENPAITHPANHADNVPTDPTFTWDAWQGWADWTRPEGDQQPMVWVEIMEADGDFDYHETLAPGTDNWSPDFDLAPGTDYVFHLEFLNHLFFEGSIGMGEMILGSYTAREVAFSTESDPDPGIPHDEHAAMWLERNSITYSDGEERNEVHTRVRHEEIMEFTVQTPWGQFVSSDGIVPTVWDGEPIWHEGDGWWLSAGTDFDRRFIEIVWHDLDQAQWDATEHEFELTAHLLGGGEWFEVWHLGTEVPMPAVSPVINTPANQATEVPLDVTFTWDAWQGWADWTRPEGDQQPMVWVEIMEADGDFDYHETLAPGTDNWSPDFDLAPGTDYVFRVEFLNHLFFEGSIGMGEMVLGSYTAREIAFETEGEPDPDPALPVWAFFELDFVHWAGPDADAFEAGVVPLHPEWLLALGLDGQAAEPWLIDMMTWESAYPFDELDPPPDFASDLVNRWDNLAVQPGQHMVFEGWQDTSPVDVHVPFTVSREVSGGGFVEGPTELTVDFTFVLEEDGLDDPVVEIVFVGALSEADFWAGNFFADIAAISSGSSDHGEAHTVDVMQDGGAVLFEWDLDGYEAGKEYEFTATVLVTPREGVASATVVPLTMVEAFRPIGAQGGLQWEYGHLDLGEDHGSILLESDFMPDHPWGVELFGVELGVRNTVEYEEPDHGAVEEITAAGIAWEGDTPGQADAYEYTLFVNGENIHQIEVAAPWGATWDTDAILPDWDGSDAYVEDNSLALRVSADNGFADFHFSWYLTADQWADAQTQDATITVQHGGGEFAAVVNLSDAQAPAVFPDITYPADGAIGIDYEQALFRWAPWTDGEDDSLFAYWITPAGDRLPALMGDDPYDPARTGATVPVWLDAGAEYTFGLLFVNMDRAEQDGTDVGAALATGSSIAFTTGIRDHAWAEFEFDFMHRPDPDVDEFEAGAAQVFPDWIFDLGLGGQADEPWTIHSMTWESAYPFDELDPAPDFASNHVNRWDDLVVQPGDDLAFDGFQSTFPVDVHIPFTVSREVSGGGFVEGPTELTATFTVEVTEAGFHDPLVEIVFVGALSEDDFWAGNFFAEIEAVASGSSAYGEAHFVEVMQDGGAVLFEWDMEDYEVGQVYEFTATVLVTPREGVASATVVPLAMVDASRDTDAHEGPQWRDNILYLGEDHGGIVLESHIMPHGWVGEVYGVELWFRNSVQYEEPLPNLAGHVELFDHSVIAAHNARFNVVIRNDGEAPVNQRVAVDVYLSPNATLDPDTDFLLGTLNPLLSIAPGAAVTLPRSSMTIPAEVQEGNYYILAHIDAENVVEETTTADNVAVSTSLLEVQDAAVQIVGNVIFTNVPEDVLSGDGSTYLARVQVANQGNIAAPVGSRVDIAVFAADGDGNVIELPTVNNTENLLIGALGPGASQIFPVSFQFPLGMGYDLLAEGAEGGEYDVFVAVDSRDIGQPDVAIVREGVDVAYGYVDFGGFFGAINLPQAVVAEQPFNGSAQVRVVNHGNVAAPAGWRADVAVQFLPEDGLHPHVLENVNVGGLAPGANRLFNVPMRFPEGVPVGEFLLQGEVVPHEGVVEHDVVPNVFALDNLEQEFTMRSDEPFVELQGEVFFNNLPAEAVSGDGSRYVMRVRVSNAGNIPTPAGTRMDLTVVARPVGSGDDILIEAINNTQDLLVAHLPANNVAPRAYTLVFELPLGMEGEYQFHAEIFSEGEVAETAPVPADPVNVTRGFVDLTGEFLRSTLPQNVVAGERVFGRVFVDVTNLGNVPLPLGQRIDIQFTAVNVSGGDNVDLPDLNNLFVSRLQPEQTRRFAVNVALPDGLPAGDYEIHALIVADDLAEEDKANNLVMLDAQGQPLTISSAPAFVDLVPSPVALPGTVLPGERHFVSVTVENQGNVRAVGSMDIEISASLNEDREPGTDHVIGMLENVRVFINPGAARAYRVPVEIPSDMPTGDYHILAFLDTEAIVENKHDEHRDNNLAVSEDQSSLAWRFGTWSDRRNAILRVEDPAGVQVVFRMVGPGFGEIDGMNAFEEIRLFDTTGSSHFLMQAIRGQTDAVSIIVDDGDIGRITAPNVNLSGNILATGGGVQHMHLGNLTGNGGVVVIAGDPDGPAGTYIFGEVHGYDLYTQTPLINLTATEWTGGSVRAPWINVLRTTGSRPLGLAGDFSAHLLLGIEPSDSFIEPHDTFIEPNDTFIDPSDYFINPDDYFIEPHDTFTPPLWTLNSALVAGSMGNRDDGPQIVNVFGNANRIAAGDAANVNMGVVGNVNNLNVGLAQNLHVIATGGVGSVFARDWQGGSVSADTLANLRVIGHPRLPGADGDFTGGLWLRGENFLPGRNALGNAIVSGGIDGIEGESLRIQNGGAGMIQAGRFGPNWTANVQGHVGTLRSMGDFEGAVTARSFNLFDVRGDMRGARVNATAASDVTSRFMFSLRNLRVNGEARDSVVRSNGNVQNIRVGESHGSTFFAGVDEKAPAGRLASAEQLGNAEIGTFQVVARGESFSNSFVAARNVQNVFLWEVETENPEDFGVVFADAAGHTRTRYQGRLRFARDIQNGVLERDGQFYVGLPLS